MSAVGDELERMRKQVAYYRRQLDELAGENLKLDYNVSGLRNELKKKRQGFGLLSELQLSIGAHKDISSIFDVTIRAINSTVGMDRTVVLTPTNREHQYHPTQWLGFRDEWSERLPALTVELPADFAQGAGLLVVNKSTATTPLIETLRAAFDLPYFICLPVMVDAPIGLLLSGRLKEAQPLYPPLDQGDVDTFQAIAGLISASVQNMRVAVLQEADRLKTEFFANISHEFRTPITLTLGPLEQILIGRYGEVPAAVGGQLGVMQRNQQRLLGLINQILDLAKLEAGGMRLNVAPLPDLNRFVEERINQFRPDAEKRGIELRTSFDPRMRTADLFVDREKLDRLLVNLLANAVKFTRQGHIAVATELHPDAVRLAVSDTGIGIAPDQLPYIFDRFHQADGSVAREYAGSGIGLALVKEIAKLHGGEVSVNSLYGTGSSFRVTFPRGKAHFNPAWIVEFAEEDLTGPTGSRRLVLIDEGATDQRGVEAPNREAETAFDPTKATILYAEDNHDLRHHVLDLLAPHYNVFLAVDGRDGLEKTRHYRPDLVLSDQMMPSMSGRDLLLAIRADPELRSTPVIFLTARAGTETRIETLDAGADDYLAKPFDEGELLARVRALLRARAQERELTELTRRLEAKIEEQVAELVRGGELKRFLPQIVVDRVLSGQLGVTERFERRRITLLFADMVGFTDLTDQLEPEDVALLLNEFLCEMTAVAIAHGGMIDKFVGDEVMVLFGAGDSVEPEAQAWAAVEAARAMRTSVGRLRLTWRRRGVGRDLDVRIGINTGYCTLGVFGSDVQRSYTAIGAPVNIAARLQAAASPGGIVCGFPTYALVQDRVRANACGSISLRGVARPIDAYEILDEVDS